MAMQVPSDGGETILVVDDDDLVLPAAKSLIEKLGYRVLTACNGPEALEILRQDTPIDLLFTDAARRNAWPSTRERGASAAARTKSCIHIGLFRVRGDPP